MSVLRLERRYDCAPERSGWAPSTALSREAQLLLLVARASLDEEAGARVRALVECGVNWDEILALAEVSGVRSLIYSTLKLACPDRVPPPVMAALQAQFQANAARNLRMATVLTRIARTFESQGIPLILFKGPLLAATAYRDLSQREFADLDVLVRPRDLARAEQILVDEGFHRALCPAGLGAVAYRQAECAFDFVSADRSMGVELHWNLMPAYFSFPFDLARIWKEAQVQELRGTRVRGLSTYDLLIFLCLHGAKHGWDELRWICDVAEIVRTTLEIDWAELRRRARVLGGERMLLLGLALANGLLGADLPDDVLEDVETDPSVCALADQVTHHLFGDGSETFGEKNLFYLRAMDSNRQRVRYCASLAIVPSKQELAARAYSAPLSFLYYALHPFNLVGGAFERLGAGALQQLTGRPARRHAHHH